MTTIDNGGASVGPNPPTVTREDLLKQFKADIYGKEVQDATTYSYVWMADQMGHVCLGIIINFALTLGSRYALPCLGLPATWDNWGGLALGALVVSVWEVSAFRNAVRGATGLFPLDRKLLRDNAVIAAFYMVLGVAIGCVFHLSEFWGVTGFLAFVLLGVILAPPWLRQKIIWQKAAMPYLFRLADVQRTIDGEIARRLQELIDQEAPPQGTPRQVIIGGPIGSGRTSIAASIGTEFAFKSAKVRYVSMPGLLEFAAQPPESNNADDSGPRNIDYWKWRQAQVVIIDDIGPLIAAREQQAANLAEFEQMLKNGLGAIAPVLAKCHTVWVIGDLRRAATTGMQGGTLDEFARTISAFCNAQQDPLVVELSFPSGPPSLEAAVVREGAPAKAPERPYAEMRSVSRRK